MEEKVPILLSIVIPVYKVAQYIERCVHSIMQQAMDDLKMECVFVDDCSPDDSVSRIEHLIASWQGNISFVILHHDRNRGLSAARNTGIKAARGEFLLFVDSDDYLKPGAVYTMLEACRSVPQIDVIVGNAFERGTGANQYALDEKEAVFFDSREEILRAMCQMKISHSAWNKLVSRRLVVDNHIFFEEGLLYEDILWTSQLFTHVERLMLLSQVTYVYEWNPSSIMQTTSARASQSVRSYTRICRLLMSHEYGSSLEVDQRLYAYSFLLCAVDIASKFKVEGDVTNFLSQTKRNMLWHTVLRGYVIMALFMLTMYVPLRYMFKWRFFRCNFNRMTNVVRQLS